jgi:hypothetical protein
MSAIAVLAAWRFLFRAAEQGSNLHLHHPRGWTGRLFFTGRSMACSPSPENSPPDRKRLAAALRGLDAGAVLLAPGLSGGRRAAVCRHACAAAGAAAGDRGLALLLVTGTVLVLGIT